MTLDDLRADPSFTEEDRAKLDRIFFPFLMQRQVARSIVPCYARMTTNFTLPQTESQKRFKRLTSKKGYES